MLPNISRSKSSQTMKFGQLIKYNVRNIFLENLWRKSGRKTSSRLLFQFEKALYVVKASDQYLSFDIFWQSLTLTQKKKQTAESFRLLIRSQILTSLRFCGKRLIFYCIQYKKVINLSSKSRRTETFTRTNYGNSDLQLLIFCGN